MKISPINYGNVSVASKGRSQVANKFVDSIKSSVVLSSRNDAFINSMSPKLLDMQMNEALKAYGITYCEAAENAVQAAAGYNGGFFSVKFDTCLNPNLLKETFVKSILKGDNLKIGGLLNYKDMVNHLKRQDIIQKGLHIHTYELNNKVTPIQAELAAKSLSKLSGKYIKSKDLFFIDSEAFYYDRLDKTAYCVDAKKQTQVQMKPTFRTCVFETDKNGSTIGYSSTAMDIFQLKNVKTVYKEQQKISEPLPSIADRKNNKLYAEAFRFGNEKPNSQKASTVLDTLSRKFHDKITEDQLQFVKLYDNNRDVVLRICYYDSSVGRSYVFNDKGSFLYEMEYNKDSLGNIVACSKY